MSLARTALRLAALAALRVDPVIADVVTPDRVYDSLIEEFEADNLVPTIVVLTEADSGEAFDRQNGGPPFDQVCSLALEIAMRQTVPNDDGSAFLSIPATDAELEASLDLIEHAAIIAVTVADTPESRLVRQAVTRRVTKRESNRFAADGTGVKYAIREVILTVELKGEDRANPLDVPAGPFAALPDPLRTVAASMPPDSSGLAICLRLAAALAGPAPQQFTGSDVTYAPKRPSYPPGSPVPLTDPNVPDPFGDTVTVPPEASDGP